MNWWTESSTRTGTIGGLATVLLFNIDTAEILSTIVLAAIGATVSFGVTLLLRFLKQKIRK